MLKRRFWVVAPLILILPQLIIFEAHFTQNFVTHTTIVLVRQFIKATHFLALFYSFPIDFGNRLLLVLHLSIFYFPNEFS